MRRALTTFACLLGISIILFTHRSVFAIRSSPFALVKYPQNISVYNRTSHGTINSIPSILDESDLVVYLGKANNYNRTAIDFQTTYWRYMPEAFTWPASGGVKCYDIIPPQNGESKDEKKGGYTQFNSNCNTSDVKITDVIIKLNDWAITKNSEYNSDPAWYIAWTSRHESMHGLGFMHNGPSGSIGGIEYGYCSPRSVINQNNCSKEDRPDEYTTDDLSLIDQYY